MKAIIPVAGMGTRLRPHTHTQPKVLLNVAGKPIIAHIMDQVIKTRIDHAVFIVGHLGEMFESWARRTYPQLKLEFIEQPQTLGLGHAVGLGLNANDAEVMIILGDTIFDVDLDKILQSPASSLGVKEVEDARRFGVVELKDGWIVNLIEKSANPPSRLAIVGLYYIKNGGLLKSCVDEIIQKNITVKGEYQITDALRLMVQKGEKIGVFPVEGWYDCGTSETLLDSNRYLLELQAQSGGAKPMAGENNIIRPPVFISPSARIENSIIGPSATISEEAIISNSIVVDSIIGDKARVENALLKRSIVGREASVRGAFKKLNISDQSEISFD
jgi:glucose-1-phosphate thymidylyltransferase